MVVAVARQLPRVADAEFAGRADLEVDPRFNNRAVLGNRHTLGAERGAAVDEGQVSIRFGVAEGMSPAERRPRGELPAVGQGDDFAGTYTEGREGDVLIGIRLQAPYSAFLLGL